MEAKVAPKAPESRPGTKPNSKDDLKSLPLEEVEKKLQSSPDGLTETEAEKRLAQYGPNEIEEKKANPFLKFLTYFWGPIPWMIEAAVILSAVARHWPDFGIILLLLLANAVVGFWEERQAGDAIDALKAKLAVKARVKRDGKWINPPARELVPGDAIRLRLGDIVPADAQAAGGRSGRSGSVGIDGRIPARHAKARRSRIFRFDYPSRRNRRSRLCHGDEHLFWQDGGTGAGRAYRQPLSTRRSENRQLPDHPRGGLGGRDCYRRDLSRRPDSHHAAIRPGADRGRNSGGDAYGPVGDDGGRRAPACQKAGDCEPIGRHRGTGRSGCAVRGQDRHADPEQADTGRAFWGEQHRRRPGDPRRRAGVEGRQQ